MSFYESYESAMASADELGDSKGYHSNRSILSI